MTLDTDHPSSPNLPRGAAARIATLAVAATLSLIAVGASEADAQSLLTGVTDPEVTYDAPLLAYQRIRAAGARYVRLTIGWSEIAPKREPSSWDPTSPADPYYWWPNADRQVINAVAAGLTPVVTLTGAPDWGQRCDRKDLPGAVCELDSVAFANFATAIARRYSGTFGGLPRVRYWQAQNEPNLYLFFNPQFGADGKPVSPDLYRTILSRFSVAVKSADPSNLVISAGLAPLQRPGSLGPMLFARRLLCMKGRKHPRPTPTGCEGGVPFDIFAIHPYTTGGPTHQAIGPDDASLGDLPEVQRLLRAADRAHRIRGAFRHTPLWLTEFSWDSRPPDPGGLPMSIHARWTAEAMFRAWRAGVSTFFWFGLRDQEQRGRPFAESVESGLYFRGPTIEQDRPKRTLEAFRFPFVALRRKNGFFVWGRTPSGSAGRVRIEVAGPRRWRVAEELRAAGNGIFRSQIRSRYGRHRGGRVRAVFGREGSVPFSLRYVEDFYQPPFGG